MPTDMLTDKKYLDKKYLRSTLTRQTMRQINSRGFDSLNHDVAWQLHNQLHIQLLEQLQED